VDTTTVDKFVQAICKLLVDYAASYPVERTTYRRSIAELLQLADSMGIVDFVEAEVYAATQNNRLLNSAWRAYNA
jgi:hypothetical protein